MKRKTFTVLSVTIIILCIITILIIMSVRTSTEKADSAVDNGGLDYAAQLVFENRLMKKCDYKIGESTISVIGYYYDGVRLYLCISTGENALTDDNVNDFSLLSDHKVYHPDKIVLGNDTDILSEYNADLLIFNVLTDIDLQNMMLSFQTDNITEPFTIKDVPVKTIEANADFEEITLHTIIFGETTTYVECDIVAKIEGSSFQAVIGDTVVPVYLVSKNGYQYEFLIPYNMDNSTSFIFVSNKMSGVELRVPINFANAVEHFSVY